MAVTAPVPNAVAAMVHMPLQQKINVFSALALVVALLAGAWMYGQQPDYRVLYASLSDHDGGAIVNALQQMNVPYKFSDGGSILVPSNRVHEVRLQLASQGLPKGSVVGFELMENQKLGTSQFLEQVNFQRALEGELARSVQSLSAVQAARVHLAISKPSVFLREQQKPSASVLLNLFPGKSLDQPQVNAIVHLVSSSVPELPPHNVTVVDQNGNLLSDTSKGDAQGLDESQLKFLRDLEQTLAKRVESILAPLVGAENVRAQVTADIDFSRSEQTAEAYKPNQNQKDTAVRSLQSAESRSREGQTDGGVPGALSNQPPGNATAPINAPAGAKNAAAKTAQQPPTSEHKETTTNFEVDKTIRHVQQPFGGIKRLSVAVVVNHIKQTTSGKVSYRPLTAAEKTQMTDLVRDAVGFEKTRNDTVSIVNSPFTTAERETLPELPLWKQPENIQLAKDAGRYLLLALVTFYLWSAYIRPLLRRLTQSIPSDIRVEPAADPESASDVDGNPALALAGPRSDPLQANLEKAKTLAREDPKLVASVVKTWVSGSG